LGADLLEVLDGSRITSQTGGQALAPFFVTATDLSAILPLTMAAEVDAEKFFKRLGKLHSNFIKNK